MTIGSKKSRRGLVLIAALAVVASACGGGASTSPGATGTAATPTDEPSTEPVVVCELAYYTGSFAPYGPALTNDVRFPIEEVINLDPPLGRSWELVSEDIGDDHEGQAAKICIEQHNAEIVVSIAHQYRTYREYMMEWWEENDSPLGPSTAARSRATSAARPRSRSSGRRDSTRPWGRTGACTRPSRASRRS
jgi:hypothetical protein